jgi:hypothetical protein
MQVAECLEMHRSQFGELCSQTECKPVQSNRHRTSVAKSWPSPQEAGQFAAWLRTAWPPGGSGINGDVMHNGQAFPVIRQTVLDTTDPGARLGAVSISRTAAQTPEAVASP